ncbi:MAG: leucine-rich repeat domain-containing protein [Lachnospiraceae bacterium]|nr:leucine-rich repeat domain-containing protein [Lachnospiraceae bacterium]
MKMQKEILTAQREEYLYLYEEINSREIRLLKAYGKSPEVVLPDQIADKSLIAIGPYCFSESNMLTPNQWESTASLNDLQKENNWCALTGNYIVSVMLPDTVTILDPYAFYNCRKLERLEIGIQLDQIQSDAFMNCQSLHELEIRGSVTDRTGLPFILNQISQELEVIFQTEQGIEAKLIYPEYTESYEEIGPAHIFGLQVEGEGYRARKQFRDGVWDGNGYDSIFTKASVEEKMTTLSKMVLNRLLYPVGLTVEHQKDYEGFLQREEKSIVSELVAGECLDELQFCISQKLLSDRSIELALKLAVENGWVRGSAGILRSRRKLKSQEDPYAF